MRQTLPDIRTPKLSLQFRFLFLSCRNISVPHSPIATYSPTQVFGSSPAASNGNGDVSFLPPLSSSVVGAGVKQRKGGGRINGRSHRRVSTGWPKRYFLTKKHFISNYTHSTKHATKTGNLFSGSFQIRLKHLLAVSIVTVVRDRKYVETLGTRPPPPPPPSLWELNVAAVSHLEEIVLPLEHFITAYCIVFHKKIIMYKLNY